MPSVLNKWCFVQNINAVRLSVGCQALVGLKVRSLLITATASVEGESKRFSKDSNCTAINMLGCYVRYAHIALYVDTKVD